MVEEDSDWWGGYTAATRASPQGKVFTYLESDVVSFVERSSKACFYPCRKVARGNIHTVRIWTWPCPGRGVQEVDDA